LGEDSFGNVFVGYNDVEGSDSFSVETEVFGETLGDHEVDSVFLPDAEGGGVSSQISCCVTLVGAVKESVKSSSFEKDGQFLPLLEGGVHSSGVMGTGMEQHDGSGFGLR
jgi:hypothetical protein